MSDDYPSRLLDRFMVRMPDGMRDRIKAAAEKNGRSMNAEIVMGLDAWLDWQERDTQPVPTSGGFFDRLLAFIEEERTKKE